MLSCLILRYSSFVFRSWRSRISDRGDQHELTSFSNAIVAAINRIRANESQKRLQQQQHQQQQQEQQQQEQPEQRRYHEPRRQRRQENEGGESKEDMSGQ